MPRCFSQETPLAPEAQLGLIPVPRTPYPVPRTPRQRRYTSRSRSAFATTSLRLWTCSLP